MASEFESQLTSFQNWANGVNPDFGRAVGGVIAANYVSTLGEAIVANPATTPATTTADKLAQLVSTVAGSYVNTVDQVLQAKLKVQQLKTAAEAERFQQAALVAGQQTAIGAGNTLGQYMPLLMIGGAGLLAVMLLKK